MNGGGGVNVEDLKFLVSDFFFLLLFPLHVFKCCLHSQVRSHFLSANLILSTSCSRGSSFAFLPAPLSLPRSFVAELSRLVNCAGSVLRRAVFEREEQPPTPPLPRSFFCTCELWPHQRIVFGGYLEIDTVWCFNSRILPSKPRRFGFIFQPTPCYLWLLSILRMPSPNHWVCWLWVMLVCSAH